MREHFIFRKHLCFAFELLSINLYELLKQNQYRGLSLNLIRIFVEQILEGLAALASISVIHCDLKVRPMRWLKLLLLPPPPPLRSYLSMIIVCVVGVVVVAAAAALLVVVVRMLVFASLILLLHWLFPSLD